MERISVNGNQLEVEVKGSGEPVVLIHGAIIAEAFTPLLAEPALTDRYRLVNYHRRGFAGSSHSDRPISMSEQAADTRGLMRALGIDRAHIVGHSYGGAIALQLALDAPDAVHTLALLEPALLDVPSGEALAGDLGPLMGMYQAGDKRGAIEAFISLVVTRDLTLDQVNESLPGASEQAVADADTFFLQELPALEPWRFTAEDAARIRQPVIAVVGADSPAVWQGYQEGHERLLAWLPHAEGFILAGATHALQMMNPVGMAEALGRFFARHPLK